MKKILIILSLAVLFSSASAQQKILTPNSNVLQKAPANTGVTPGPTSSNTALINDISTMFANMQANIEQNIEKLKRDVKSSFEQFKQQSRNKIVQDQQRISWLDANITLLEKQRNPLWIRKDELKRDSLRNALNIATITNPIKVPLLRDSLNAVERRINVWLSDIPRISSLIVQYTNEKQQLQNEIRSLEAEIVKNEKKMLEQVAELDKSKQQLLTELEKQKQKTLTQANKMIEENKMQDLEALKRTVTELLQQYAETLSTLNDQYGGSRSISPTRRGIN